jgi:predicted nucleotidyltransferase
VNAKTLAETLETDNLKNWGRIKMFNSRHYIRDVQLPVTRDNMLRRAIEILEGQEYIEGIFLGGSIAKENTDLYSDIDLRIVVSEGQFNEYIRNKQDILRSFGDILFFEDMNPKAPFSIGHYDNFIKIDLFIYTYSRLQPSIWLNGIKVVFDPNNQLMEILAESNKIKYQVTQGAVINWEGKIFSYIHEVYRRVMREEYYYALTIINNLRSFIVMGWNMEVDRHSNDAWDWSKIEGKRTQLEPSQLELLAGWSCGRDQKEIMSTLWTMIPEIRRLHIVLRGKTGLEIDESHFERVINLVL